MPPVEPYVGKVGPGSVGVEGEAEMVDVRKFVEVWDDTLKGLMG